MIESKIKELVEKSGYKRSFIAEKINVSVKQLRNYERGHSYVPMDKAFKLAELLGVKVDDLYSTKEEEK